MPITKINLQDGVQYDGRHIDALALRQFQFNDLVVMTAVDLGTMPGSLTMLSRLSGEPFEALSTLTQDDAHAALLGLSEHMDKHLPAEAR